MTIFCWPCHLEEFDRKRRGEPPVTILQAITIVDGRGLCAAHAALRLVFAEEVTPIQTDP